SDVCSSDLGSARAASSEGVGLRVSRRDALRPPVRELPAREDRGRPVQPEVYPDRAGRRLPLRGLQEPERLATGGRLSGACVEHIERRLRRRPPPLKPAALGYHAVQVVAY